MGTERMEADRPAAESMEDRGQARQPAGELTGNKEQTERLARQIFETYNAVQRKRNPGRALEYPRWEEAPETVRNANRRQAEGIFEKAALLGCEIVLASSAGDEVAEFTEEEIEFLARLEHEAWAEDRRRDGWSLGQRKDVARKQTPYLTGYDELSEEIKELDRDAVRNVIPLLRSMGLKVVRPGEGRQDAKKAARGSAEEGK